MPVHPYSHEIYPMKSPMSLGEQASDAASTTALVDAAGWCCSAGIHHALPGAEWLVQLGLIGTMVNIQKTMENHHC